MKKSLIALVVFMGLIFGCVGGQGIIIRAERGSTVREIRILIDDGGTDLGGLFYRPSGGSIVKATTQPENNDAPKR